MTHLPRRAPVKTTDMPIPMSQSDPTQDFVPLATAALDLHRLLNLPDGSAATDRAELDALHAHLISLHQLLDAHAVRTSSVAAAEGDHLRAVRTRLWQAAEHLHAAFHAAPRPTAGRPSAPEAHRTGPPEGPPRLAVCRRHLRTALRVRRQTTPADLYDPFTGLVRH